MRNKVQYYRSRCGSAYRIRVMAATSEMPSRVLQARCSSYSTVFGPEYLTHPEKINRLIAIGFLVEITRELLQPAYPT